MALALTALLLVSLAGCGTAAWAVRLDTGEGKTLVLTPRDVEPPVQLREGEFKESTSPNWMEAVGQALAQAGVMSSPSRS